MTVTDLRANGLGALLNLGGVVIISWVLIAEFAGDYISGWVFVVGVISLIAWILLGDRALWQPPVVPFAALALVMVVAGAAGAAPSNGLLIVPAIVGVLRLVGDVRIKLWIGVSTALLGAALVAAGSITVTVTTLGLLSLEGGMLLGLLGGMNRRQSRIAAIRERELLERTHRIRDEEARVSSLETRQSLARDIHDVLAHSLGGLVIQLDATDALLEAGHVAEAAVRVRDARALAVSGLGEARRAVDTLRDPDGGFLHGADAGAGADPARADNDISTAVADLAAAHERLGAPVRYSEIGTSRTIPDATALAFRRAVQESLSNARKHASGELVTMELVWSADRLRLTVSNPLAGNGGTSASPAASAVLAASGGGNGLRGMRARFDSVPGGRLEAGVRENRFVISAEAELRA